MKMLLLSLVLILIPQAALGANKELLLIAGVPSHGKEEHEFRAGALLLAEALNRIPGYHATVASNGWPADPKALESADAILLYADGGDGHPAIRPERLKLLDALAARGVGIGAAHYRVREVPRATGRRHASARWTGGYFETFWSVNPHWVARFASYLTIPSPAGLTVRNQRRVVFSHAVRARNEGVTSVRDAVAPAETMNRGDGPHSGNPAVRESVKKNEPQVLMWAYDRPGGGRGFGFTGGHFHRNWAEPNFRKAVLNALVWIAGGEVPAEGIESSVTPDQLSRNLDPK
ncbi:MAG: hypothetical protein KIT22_01065 [Verrucomicrobiae bacterium]|nr:hypothetical protein [Verrucomicrobiae bacterium]